VSNWWKNAPLAEASPSAENDSWWKMAPEAAPDPLKMAPNAKAMIERGRLKGPVEIGQLPQGINEALYQTVSMPGDALAWTLKQVGLRDGNAPPLSETLRGSLAPPDATYTPNKVPETIEGRAFNDVGQAIGAVASTAVPAAAAIGMTANAAPSLGRGIAQTLAAQPGMQVAANSAGNLTTDFTGNPLLGLGASLFVPFAANSLMRVPYSAPAKTGAEAERRALLGAAKNEGILPSFGTIMDSHPAKMLESVISKLPFMGGTQARINEGNKTALDKAFINKIPQVRGEGIDAYTVGNRDMIGGRIGKTFNALENNTTVNIDPQVGSDISKAMADFSKNLRSNMSPRVTAQLDELAGAAAAKHAPQIDGTTYKNIRSDLSAMLTSSTGTDRQAVGAMINALDGAVERSIPKDMVKDWQDARLSWRRHTMLKDATDARHNAQTDVGHIPPGAVAARAGNDKEMERLAQIGTSFVGDKMPDSGTSLRLLFQNGLGLGAGAGAATQFPLTTAALAGGGYATNLLLNNPYTRKALIDRLNNSREGVLNKGLVATLAAQQGSR
jgi:hypothetical protein